jgi:hypothetical protein
VSRWETTSTLEAGVNPASVWQKAYADASAWPRWNAELKRVRLDGPLALGATAARTLQAPSTPWSRLAQPERSDMRGD